MVLGVLCIRRPRAAECIHEQNYMKLDFAGGGSRHMGAKEQKKPVAWIDRIMDSDKCSEKEEVKRNAAQGLRHSR